MYLCQNLHIERGVNFYKQTLAIFFQVLFLEKNILVQLLNLFHKVILYTF